VLSELQETGVRVVLDNFGTGYSSLALLRRLPVDALKMDRSFVQSVDADSDHQAIASAVIGMGRSLGLEVVAEGVETQAQLGYLRERGWARVQGHYLGEPRDGADLVAWLQGIALQADTDRLLRVAL
jgi:EAL domain-containing protein (putative c-di-GMP-specific phosphodiesterase class I)